MTPDSIVRFAVVRSGSVDAGNFVPRRVIEVQVIYCAASRRVCRCCAEQSAKPERATGLPRDAEAKLLTLQNSHDSMMTTY